MTKPSRSDRNNVLCAWRRGSGYVGQTRLFVLNVNVPVEKQATFSSFSLVKMVLYHYQFIE